MQLPEDLKDSPFKKIVIMFQKENENTCVIKMINIGLKIIYQLIFSTSLQALALGDFFARHHQIFPEKTNIF